MPDMEMYRETEERYFPDFKLDYSTDMVCEDCGSNEWHVNLFYKNTSRAGGWYYGEDGDYGTEDVWCHECEGYRNLLTPYEFQEQKESE